MTKNYLLTVLLFCQFANSYTQTTLVSGNYIISGKVTSSKGLVLTGVSIYINNERRGQTDADGLFQVNLDSNDLQSDQIIRVHFMQEGYSTATRNYHQVMGKATVDIQLEQPCICDSLKGCFTVEEYQFLFEKDGLQLADPDKYFLQKLADNLKSNPECILSIDGYGDTKSMQRETSYRLGLIKNWLELSGISPHRVTTNMVPQALLKKIELKVKKQVTEH